MTDEDEQLEIEVSKFFADPLGFVMFAFDWTRDPDLQFVKLVEPWKSRFKCEWGPDRWFCELCDYISERVLSNGFNGKHSVDAIRVAVVSGHGIGKSAGTAMLIEWLMSTRPNAKGIVSAATLPQLETKTWAELAKWNKRSITGHWFTISTGRNSMSMRRIGMEESWRCDAQTCREENSESFAGQHSVSSTSFYIFDESSGIPDKIYDVADPGGMTDGEPMMFCFGNPTKNTGWFRECFRSRKHRWKTYQIDSRTVQITNKRQLQELVDDYGEDHDKVRIRVRGEFPMSSSYQFIADDVAQGAMKREAVCYPNDPLVIGVDVARFGDDDSVILIRKGRDARTFPALTFSKVNTMELAAQVQTAWLRYQADAVFVDGGGVGGGVIDRLRQLGVPVMEVQFGAKADRGMFGYDKNAYANKRAEMWGHMREWLSGGAIPDNETYKKQLISPEYDVITRNGADCILLESKESMKAAGKSSPDWADALACTFAYPVSAKGIGGGVHRKAAVAEGGDFDPYREIWSDRSYQ